MNGAPSPAAGRKPVGAILAGGEARRLGGVDKASIEIEGITLAQRAVTLLRPHCEELLALTGRGASFPVPGIETVRDRFPGLGPLAGLDAAFQARPGRTILLLAVDLCFLPSEIPALLARALRREPDAPAIVPVSEGAAQPVCALYRPALADPVASRLRHGGPLAMRALAELGSVLELPFPAGTFAGVNTAEVLQELRRMHGPHSRRSR